MGLRVCRIDGEGLMELIARVVRAVHFDQELGHFDVRWGVVQIGDGVAEFAQGVGGASFAAKDFGETAMRRGIVRSREQSFGEGALGIVKIAGREKLLAALDVQGERILRSAGLLLRRGGRAGFAART